MLTQQTCFKLPRSASLCRTLVHAQQLGSKFSFLYNWTRPLGPELKDLQNYDPGMMRRSVGSSSAVPDSRDSSLSSRGWLEQLLNLSKAENS